MGERTSYTPGTFSWAELLTSDADAAKGFYTQLFGWDYEDNPTGPDPEAPVYSMATRDGHHVAALFADESQPPHWNCYVTVTSAGETAAKAAETGGTVIAEAFDVMEVGRMAVIADPTGAALCLWEPRQHIGATLVNTPGSMAWNDLVTPDPEAAADFYGKLFGWTFEEMPESGGYRVIRNGETSNGGIFSQQGPSAWIPYFGHDDVDRLAGEIEGLGGRLFNGPMQVPSGSFVVLADPQGAVFAALTSGQYDD
jgi:predicted enzyme related to lactoylglutathione lyase